MKYSFLRTGFYDDLKILLEKLNLFETIEKQKRIIIKPNLTCCLKPPVTTNPELVRRFVEYIKENSKAEIIIAEGSGGDPTSKCFKELGWEDLADKFGLELVDLNEDETRISINKNCFILKEFHLPKSVEKGFLISVAVLKHHSEAKVTLGLKNMMGLAQGKFFSEDGTRWHKAKFHSLDLAKCIVDVNLHRKPDFVLIDGIVGQVGGEIYGIPRQFNILIAGYDPVATDSFGARVLGIKPKSVEHIRLAEEKGLGRIE